MESLPTMSSATREDRLQPSGGRDPITLAEVDDISHHFEAIRWLPTRLGAGKPFILEILHTPALPPSNQPDQHGALLDEYPGIKPLLDVEKSLERMAEKILAKGIREFVDDTEKFKFPKAKPSLAPTTIPLSPRHQRSGPRQSITVAYELEMAIAASPASTGGPDPHPHETSKRPLPCEFSQDTPLATLFDLPLPMHDERTIT